MSLGPQDYKGWSSALQAEYTVRFDSGAVHGYH